MGFVEEGTDRQVSGLECSNRQGDQASCCSPLVEGTLAELSLADPFLDKQAEEGAITGDSNPLMLGIKAAMAAEVALEQPTELFSSKVTGYQRPP